MLGASSRLVAQTMLWATRTPLRWVAVLAYRLVIWSAAGLLRWGDPDSAVYLRGGWGRGESVPGLSDIDLALVVADGRADRLRRRWRRLLRAVPAAGSLIQLAVYGDAELLAAVSAPTLSADSAVHLGPSPLPDEAGLRVRPGLLGPLQDWRGVAGPNRLPPAAAPDAQGRRVGAWLELQAIWRDAFRACARPAAVTVPHLCVKLVADPARIWLGLVEGAHLSRRREVLELGQRLIPEEAAALAAALALYDALDERPVPPLADSLSACLRLSDRLAGWLIEDLRGAGRTAVRLVGTDGHDLALPPEADAPLRRLLGEPPRLQPLLDWRALAWPLHPDDAFAATRLSPAEPEGLGAAVMAAGSWGPYPALSHGELIVLAGPGLLRAVQCRLTDPVTFAISRGQTVAEFPDVAGWSAPDWARRAVLEHRAWLGVGPVRQGPLVEQWMQSLWRTSAPDAVVIGLLLSAARAALFAESLDQGRPELAVTVSAAAAALDARLGGAGTLAREAAAAYRACRLAGTDPPVTVVMNLREAVLGLPAFALPAPG
jgi:hypothetical protein